MNTKLIVWIFCLLCLTSIAVAVHPQYPSYAQPQSGFIIAENFVNVQDDLIYSRAYYSINGNAWIPVTLQGSPYKNSARWLGGSASALLPSFGEGEHYVLAYSCSVREGQQRSWNCNEGKWQLHIITNLIEQNISIITTWASIEQDATHGPQTTLDGQLTDDAYWAAEGDNHWVAYEFSEVATVRWVELAFTHDSSRTFELQTSMDGQTWKTVFGENISAPDSAHVMQRFTFPPVQARYLRFLGHGSSESGRDGWNTISEININDFAVDLPEVVCEPNNNECGSDGCGGSHGDCASGVCVNGRCEDSQRRVLWQMDFEHRPLGKYATRAAFAQDFRTGDSWGNRGEDLEIVRDPDNPDNKVGKFTYASVDSTEFTYTCYGDPQCYDSERRHNVYTSPPSYGRVVEHHGVGPWATGGQWYVDLGASPSEAYYSFRIRIDPGFANEPSGKLPSGFFPEDRPCGCENTDCQYANGKDCPVDEQPCDGVADDFSAGRYMLHQDHISYYIYFADKKNACGDSRAITDSEKLFDGEWHTIQSYVRLNDPDSHNGVMRTWIDGEEQNSWTGIMWRTGDTHLTLDTFTMATFFGGNSETRCDLIYDANCGGERAWSSQRDRCAVDPSDPCSDVLRYSDGTPWYYWAPKQTVYIWVDDYVVWT